MEDSLRLPNVSKSSWHIGCHGPVGCGSLLPTVDFITGDIFSKALAAHGVVQRFAGQDAPEQLWADAKEMAD